MWAQSKTSPPSFWFHHHLIIVSISDPAVSSYFQTSTSISRLNKICHFSLVKYSLFTSFMWNRCCPIPSPRCIWFHSLLTFLKDRGAVENFRAPRTLININNDFIRGLRWNLDRFLYFLRWMWLLGTEPCISDVSSIPRLQKRCFHLHEGEQHRAARWFVAQTVADRLKTLPPVRL